MVTANKELIAAHGAVLAEAAASAGVDLLYEAAVAGAIPLIRSLRESLAGEPIRRVMGIVNGTTNFILTMMAEEGVSYAQALAEAQRLGLAERDPSADVEGYDAAAKAAILAALAFRCDVVAADVPREGIAAVAPVDIAFAARLGYVVKLLAVVERTDGSGGKGAEVEVPEISVRVHPAMLPRTHPLAVGARCVQRRVRRGRELPASSCSTAVGAGGPPTASAVLGDLIDAAHHLRSGLSGSLRGARAAAHPSHRRPALRVVPEHGRRRPARRARRGRPALRRPRRVDPVDGAGRAWATRRG